MDVRHLWVVALIVLLAAPQEGRAEVAGTSEGGCLVTGLDPNGDGFLSVRTGPGTGNREVARVRNGDALFFDQAECRGKWCFADGGAINGRTSSIRGWFYTAWCEFYP